MNRHEPALLDLQNVSVMRGQKVVLENFSLRIRGDEHVAILGPNGCGKSTLIKTITRECYPVAQEGSSMTILGQERWDVFELRSLLGIVSNDLMSTCTGNACGRDVVLSGFFSSTRIFPHHTVDPRHRELADAALAQLQISHLADRPVAEMSSGEARRVLIAARPGSQTASLAVRRTQQLAGRLRPAELTSDHEFAGESGDRNHSGHA